MTGKQWVIILLTWASLWAVTRLYDSYLKNKLEVLRAELSSREYVQRLERDREFEKAQGERTQMLLDIMKRKYGLSDDEKTRPLR